MTQPTVSEFVNDWFDTHRSEIIGWRRHIHSHPETSNQEFETTNYLAKTLGEYGVEAQRFPETGLMVDIGPDTEEGRIAFRADIDALPVDEVTGLECSSQSGGVSCGCGHDADTTIALGAVCAVAGYNREVPLSIGVRVIFEPAGEVCVGGATDVIEGGALKGVHSTYAVYVEPKL